jgi:hypothetical protein
MAHLNSECRAAAEGGCSFRTPGPVGDPSTAPKVTFFESIEEPLQVVEVTQKGVEILSVSVAFRRYNWLFQPLQNASGNMRGMVIDAKAGRVFAVSKAVGRKLQVLAVLLALAEESYIALEEYEDILASDESAAVKWGKLKLLELAIIARAGVNVIAGTVETAIWLTEKTRHINPVFWYDELVHVRLMGREPTFKKDLEAARRLVTRGKVEFRELTSPENVMEHLSRPVQLILIELD